MTTARDIAAVSCRGCLCGAVHDRVEAELGTARACHCAKCRKTMGTAFATIVPVPTVSFQLESGVEPLREYGSSSGVLRVFCGRCGSPLYSRRPAQPDLLRLRLGSLESPYPGRISAHLFTASKAEWLDIRDPAPQYAERP
jgi:hypothetical protein